MKKHLDLKIFGKVQGVFFRHAAKEKAEELNIVGRAFNEPDETVYIEAEGEESNLERFIEWCKKGPPMASVEKVESNFSDDLKEYKNFQVM